MNPIKKFLLQIETTTLVILNQSVTVEFFYKTLHFLFSQETAFFIK